MQKRLATVLGSGIIVMGSLANPAWAGCVTAKGKIANNALAGSATLGVAALELGAQKLKCAIAGAPQLVTPDGPNYRHTLVCDDQVGTGQPQSQITFDTFFVSQPVTTGQCQQNNPFGPVSFAFQERSIPDSATARGVFVGAVRETSQINITGDFNCNGGINMKFQGQICFAD